MNRAKEWLKSRIPYKWRRYDYWVKDRIKEKTGMVVSKGPFKGMKYFEEALGWSRILGTYEQELHDTIIKAVDLNIPLIINAGAAEGYYAIGFLMGCQRSRVIAFESEVRRQQLMKQLALINNVADRLDIKGFCDENALNDALPEDGSSLVIMDIEGGEKSLLDPAKLPSLKHAHIIVEVHDYLDRTMTKTLVERFADTHHIETIRSEWRTLEDLPFSTSFIERLLVGPAYAKAMFEGRGEIMHWLCMHPKGKVLKTLKDE